MVRTVRVMARETEWASCLEASEAATPMKPASSSGQHHDPTSAGTLSATVKTEAQISGVARGTEGAAGTPTRDPLSSDSNPQVTQSSTSTASPRRVSRRALILFRLVRLAPPETPWGRRLEAEIRGSVLAAVDSETAGRANAFSSTVE